MPKIVFATGYMQYALKGYEYGVVDYILKPVSYTRFKKSIDRILNDLDSGPGQNKNNLFFFADVDCKKVKIDFNTICYIEGARNYILIVCEHKRYITYRSMRSMLELLPKEDFMRVHKSYIASLSKIRELIGNQIVYKIKDKEKLISIGLTYRGAVLKRLRV